MYCNKLLFSYGNLSNAFDVDTTYDRGTRIACNLRRIILIENIISTIESYLYSSFDHSIDQFIIMCIMHLRNI